MLDGDGLLSAGEGCQVDVARECKKDEVEIGKCEEVKSKLKLELVDLGQYSRV